MHTLDIHESHELKRDRLFHLHRVTTSGGERRLLKSSAVLDHGGHEALLRHEFSIFKQVATKRVLSPIELAPVGGRLCAWYRDSAGRSLAEDGPFRNSKRARSLLRELCAALDEVHQHDVLLLGLAPCSFLVQPDGTIHLCDAPFARSAMHGAKASERDWLNSPFLPYAAPEALAEASATLDRRTDLYALGAIAYELIAGVRPFPADDPLELIQAHLAKQPRPLAEVAPELPSSLSGAIMRLLAKDRDERFASTRELLAACAPLAAGRGTYERAALEAEHQAEPNWSKSLRGRDELLRRLCEQLEGSARPALTLVKGEPGSGKTALLQALEKAASGHRVHWCRFLRSGPDQPLSGWLELLRLEADAALCCSTVELRNRRERLLHALGDSALVLASLVKEWDAALNTGLSSSSTFAQGSLNRTAVAIQRLLASEAQDGARTLLILDDLQWADASSLRILELVLGLPESSNITVVAALRSVDAGNDPNALLQLEERLCDAGVAVDILDLAGWDQFDIGGFIADSFGSSFEACDELAQLLMPRTRGNPLFVQELLSALVRERSIIRIEGTWRWRGGALANAVLPESLLAMLVGRMRELSAEAKNVLTVAACVGHHFSQADLCAASGADVAGIARGLETALNAGLIVVARSPGKAATDSAHLDFVHDRVLEACLELSTAAERSEFALRIFREQQHTADLSDHDALFRQAGFLLAGAELLESMEERVQGARLLLRAGSLARAKGANAQALPYMQGGLALLHADGCARHWHERFELTHSLHEEAAEVALLNSDFELVQSLCAALLARARQPIDKLVGYDVLIRSMSARGLFGEALETALAYLEELHIRFPRRPNKLHVIAAYVRTRRRVFARGVERLRHLPKLADPAIAAASRIMQSLYAVAYFNRPQLFSLLVLRQVENSLSYGNSEYASEIYSTFSVVLAGLGAFDDARALGDLSLELLKAQGAEKLVSRVFMGHYSFVFPWHRPIRDTQPFYAHSIASGLAHGDFEYVGYSVTMLALARLHGGEALPGLERDFAQYTSQLASLGHERSSSVQRLVSQLVHELSHGLSSDVLNGPLYEAAENFPEGMSPVDHTAVFHHFFARLVLCVCYGDRERALAAAQAAEAHVEAGAFANFLWSGYLFFEAWVWGTTPKSQDQGHARRKLRAAIKRLRKWAESAPMNFASKLHFAEAEYARLRGKYEAASQAYEAALEHALKENFQQELGVIQERAATLCLERGRVRLAAQYLRDSFMSYRRWGARPVSQRLSRAYPQHFALFEAEHSPHDGSASMPEQLDFRVLIKSSQAISSEILLPNLVARLLNTILEHTGAQRGVLMLERRGELVVEAESDVERAHVAVIAGETVDGTERLCRSVVHYAARMERAVVLADARQDPQFHTDPYVLTAQPRSVLCVPILYQAKLLGLVYLENNHVTHVFTQSRLEIVNLLAGQAAISIANARFHMLQLEAQQAKTSPHFLFNALSSIAELTVIDGARAETAVVKLAHLYRYILTSSTNDLVSLAQELAIVRDYLSLEKLRFGDKLEFTVTHEGAIGAVKLPGLLIQPLVENSIRHGVAPKLDAGHVWVYARVSDTTCSIVVQDDGAGAKAATSGTGFGLRSVQQRLELIYGQNFSFAISRRGGYRVEVEVPLAPGGRG